MKWIVQGKGSGGGSGNVGMVIREFFNMILTWLNRFSTVYFTAVSSDLHTPLMLNIR